MTSWPSTNQEEQLVTVDLGTFSHSNSVYSSTASSSDPFPGHSTPIRSVYHYNSNPAASQSSIGASSQPISSSFSYPINGSLSPSSKYKTLDPYQYLYKRQQSGLGLSSSAIYQRFPNSNSSNSLMDSQDEKDKAKLANHRSTNVTHSGTLYAPRKSSIRKDLSNMILLVILYLIQGVPLGLAFGSVPFILQQKLSYTEIGIFSLASYPYSLKLLWSPIVDVVYSERIGRRKSWILPIQLCTAVLLYIIGLSIDETLKSDQINVLHVTVQFFLLVLMAATQDIAVDGWAITILSKANKAYAATCQNLGLNAGYFLSFTVFLALNSPEFCHSYLFFLLPSSSASFTEGLLQLGEYMRLWSIFFFVVTVLVFVFKKEGKEKPNLNGKKEVNYLKSEEDEEEEEEDDDNDEEMSVCSVYQTCWELMKTAHIQSLIQVLLICKLGFSVSDSVTALALLSRGFRKDWLAMFVLLDFPLQIVYAIVAGHYSKGKNALHPWLISYRIRLFICLASMLLIYLYPIDGIINNAYFYSVLLFTLLNSCSATIMNVCQGAFFARISDTKIGGTYLTLLNTVSNLGGTWPKIFVLLLVDQMSERDCIGPNGQIITISQACTKQGSLECASLNGKCELITDGYFSVGLFMLFVGAALYLFISVKLRKLQSMHQSAWSVSSSSASSLEVVVEGSSHVRSREDEEEEEEEEEEKDSHAFHTRSFKGHILQA